MGAHRHRIIRQRSSRRRGSSKFSDSASSVGDDESCSTSGSAADAFSGPNGKDGGLTPGTLMRHPSVSSSSGGSGKGGEDCGRAGATNEGGDDGVPPLHGVPGYHPDAGRSERIGFAGRLSSSHEVPRCTSWTVVPAYAGECFAWIESVWWGIREVCWSIQHLSSTNRNSKMRSTTVFAAHHLKSSHKRTCSRTPRLGFPDWLVVLSSQGKTTRKAGARETRCSV